MKAKERIPRCLAYCWLLASVLLFTSLQGGASVAGALKGKRVLFVIFDRFDQSEYGKPRSILERQGAHVTTASSSRRPLQGYQGSVKLRADLLLKDARMKEFDALVFVGGYRYESSNPETYRLVHEALRGKKPVAAICIAPVTLAKAGVIRGKRVTASTRFKTLKGAGGILTGKNVERDGLLITANGPAAAEAFGHAIAAALGGK